MKAHIKAFALLMTLSFAALSQSGCAGDSNQSNASGAAATANRQETSEPATAIGAEELIESYRMVESGGAGKYKGKTLAVTGTVTRIGKDFQNNLYVNLKGENTVIEVHCIYTEDQQAAMSALKPGQQATIRGVCDGRFMSYVMLKNSVPQ